jgi:very-short-patch-repair endonuclease
MRGFMQRPTKQYTKLARKLRKQPTRAEQIMWRTLRNYQLDGIKFTRQVPIEGFIVDFCCRSHKLIIEIDGGIHIGREREDHQREVLLERLGYKFLRFTNDQVMHDLNQVIEVIRSQFSVE